jgi:mono/diheme cytochrome c family protein
VKKRTAELPWGFLFGLALTVLLLVFLAGWRGHVFRSPPLEIFSDMVRQPRVNPQAPSSFFADGRGARPPVQGTIPLGYSMPQHSPVEGQTVEGPSELDFGIGSSYRDTGRFGTRWGTGIPLEVNAALMQRGRERFSIHCAVCHGATGWGDGIATKYGLVGVANLQLARIRSLPDGEIFDVITHGKNLMMALGAKIPVPDRWAIIVYLRALQRSQQTEFRDLSVSERAKLEAQP